MFDASRSNDPSGYRLDLPDAEIVFYPEYFTASESTQFLTVFMSSIRWQHEHFRIFGRSVPVPRLTAWHGDPGKTYSYSGLIWEPHDWTPDLLTIKSRIEPVCGVRFNSVLLNWYRGEHDSMGWHADDEPELGPNPVIGSVSFGGCRRLQFKHRTQKNQRAVITMTSGSLLVMAGATQHHWLHAVPKEKTACEPRINLTFRVIV